MSNLKPFLIRPEIFVPRQYYYLIMKSLNAVRPYSSLSTSSLTLILNSGVMPLRLLSKAAWCILHKESPFVISGAPSSSESGIICTASRSSIVSFCQMHTAGYNFQYPFAEGFLMKSPFYVRRYVVG